jgi:hypothetical protein
VECGVARIADQGFAFEALDRKPKEFELTLNVVEGPGFFRGSGEANLSRNSAEMTIELGC